MSQSDTDGVWRAKNWIFTHISELEKDDTNALAIIHAMQKYYYSSKLYLCAVKNTDSPIYMPDIMNIKAKECFNRTNTVYHLI